MKTIAAGVSVLFVEILAVGCGGGGGSPDAGPDVPPPILLGPDGGAPDLACLHNNPDPVPTGALVNLTITIKDFQMSTPVSGAMVEVYYNDTVDGTPDQTAGPTDTTGVAAFTNAPERGLIAYRVASAPSARVSTEYDVLVPIGGGNFNGVSVSNATYMIIPTVWGVAPDPTKGVVAGRFRDCAGDPISGATAAVVDASGTDVGGEDHYFRMEFPNPDQLYTSDDGLFGVVNVPPGDWFIELSGRAAATDPLAPFGRRAVQVIANGISIHVVTPLAQ